MQVFVCYNFQLYCLIFDLGCIILIRIIGGFFICVVEYFICTLNYLQTSVLILGIVDFG